MSYSSLLQAAWQGRPDNAPRLSGAATLRAWWQACRPPFFITAAIPVTLALAFAFRLEGQISPRQWTVYGLLLLGCFMGLTIANIGGVPAATWLGETIGWRMSFMATAGLGVIAMVSLFFSLPKGGAGERPDVRSELAVLMRPQVLSALLTTVLGAGAMFTLYTYISPVLHDITHATPLFVTAMLVLIGVGLWMIFTGFTSTTGEVAAFSHLWSHGGLFPTGVTGFLAGFQIAIFAFVGVELVGTTAAETKDPEKNLPKAVNSIPIRIIVFYVLSLVIVMSVTPWNRIDPSISPFVNLFSQAGIAAAAIIMNLVVLSSVMSSMNSGVFSTSRMLFGLARGGQAPQALARLSKRAVPAQGLIFSCLFIMAGAGLQYFVPNTVEAFTLATTLSTILFICVWLMIIWSYIVYYKTRPELHAKSTFKLPGGLFTCWVLIIFFIGMIYVLSLEADTMKALMVSPIWFIILIIGYFGFYKPRHK